MYVRMNVTQFSRIVIMIMRKREKEIGTRIMKSENRILWERSQNIRMLTCYHIEKPKDIYIRSIILAFQGLTGGTIMTQTTLYIRSKIHLVDV